MVGDLELEPTTRYFEPSKLSIFVKKIYFNLLVYLIIF